ncbi:hypothetical protein AOZ06_07855 [Kibdelosporangium phytohabitans]|uniref:Uncharacterized protein n=1 Tax=Kibdelosporangium phytohabitans TaxID=860235 RepID=A0A0N9HQ90_9PSEU|nr:hypothetical protein AOZ06_07855 [Kibdelosporangium phytohabitans]
MLALRAELEELKRRTLYSAAIGAGGLRVYDGGAISVESGMGHDTFYAGKSDVNGKQVTFLKRHNGSNVFGTGIYVPNGEQYWAMYDRGNNILVSDDAASGVGLANPWLSIPLYPCFSVAASAIYGYMNLPASSVASETVLWSGRIPQMHHGFVGIDGVWGQASGANSATYKLKLNGTIVGSWSTGGALEVANKGPFNANAFINQQWIAVDLTVQASGTGNVAAQIAGCTCRGS